jgi:predicted DsbA family dithiol-disulfide isomerase
VRDFAKIAEYGVMTTPALVVDQKVLVSGRVADAQEVAQLIRKARNLV